MGNCDIMACVAAPPLPKWELDAAAGKRRCLWDAGGGAVCGKLVGNTKQAEDGWIPQHAFNFEELWARETLNAEL